MPTLHRLSDADPAALTAELEAVWSAGDAAVVLPPGDPPGAIAPLLDPAVHPRSTAPDDAALVVMTSGSTGRPRAVVLRHAALASAVAASAERLKTRRGERWALALPTRHVAGVMVLLRARALGTAPVLVDPGDAAALAAAADEAHHVAIVPTQLARALDAGHDLTGFRTVLVGGGPAPDVLLGRARAAGIPIVTSYGMTETCGGCVYDGAPLAGTEIALTSDGRVRLRGPSITACAPDGTPLTDDGGWLTTADRGRLADGRLEVLGRVDDVIVTGGENVDPAAIAAVIRTRPGVTDATVVGVPDPVWGQRVRAVVVADAPIALLDLRTAVSERLGTAHAPRDLLVVPSLPRDGMGKIVATARLDLVSATPTETHRSTP